MVSGVAGWCLGWPGRVWIDLVVSWMAYWCPGCLG